MPVNKRFSIEDVSPHLLQAHYEIRGRIPQRADELGRLLSNAKGKHSLPFDHIIYCNLGNPQALKQPPFTYHRQVLKCELIDSIASFVFFLVGSGCFGAGRFARKTKAEFVERKRQMLAKALASG